MALILQIKAETKAAQRQIESAAKKTGASVEKLEQRSTRSASRMTSGFNKVSKALGPLGIGLGVGGVLIGFKKIIGLASDTEESLSKVREVFGAAAGEIEAFAERGAVALGASKQATLEMTGEIGNLLVAFGLTEEAAADFSQTIVQSSADIGSFNNVATKDVLIAYRAALVGSSEPMLRFGADTRITRLEQIALETGIIKTKRALTAQERALAAVAAVQRDTAKAQGNYALTADQLANSSKTLSAQIDNLGAALGKAFTPAVTDAVRSLTTFIDVTSGLADGTKELDTDWKGLLGTFLVSVPGLRDVGTGLINASVGAGHLGVTAKEAAEGMKELNKVTDGTDGPGIGPTVEEFERTKAINAEIQSIMQAEMNRQIHNAAILQMLENVQPLYGKIEESSSRTEIALVGMQEPISIVRQEQQAIAWAASTSATEMERYAAAILQALNIYEQAKRSAGGFLGTVLGGIGGFILGGPAGALKGATLGGQLGGRLGFQHGGSFMVGGTGTQDRLVPVPLAPGERVDVTPRNQVTNNRSINISITTRTIDEAFVRRELAPLMQRLTRDGNVSFGAA